jgi:hypothetical protein
MEYGKTGIFLDTIWRGIFLPAIIIQLDGTDQIVKTNKNE